MSTATNGPAHAGSARFLPFVSDASDGLSTVSLLRRLPDDTFASVWSHECAPLAARAIGEWMWSQPEQWRYWGQLAVRLGDAVVGPIILDAATEAAVMQAKEQRREEERRLEEERLAQVITLYSFDPKKGRPALGLERGCDDAPFWKMKFNEKWERDRVVDYLRWQKPRFVDLDAHFRERGALELERLILSEMREAEKRARTLGISSGGRRPLRFWRGEA
ncbi:hypothetical protein sphantq_02514 [Sphingobium sp. AntQ-1]|uniref:hypothetical protein n=1 Tax=Sphingobium sp. AntQ-1 TaxID=2930091 RepID=UPI00234EFAA7|nr:hypothetical protein [Sphingobium sp. AntQ-1]WCP14072.1 hypothetical protein sphantq_02514 [Sphingobium sp. AntQ-1]